jgi:hypothetical protein
MKIEKVSEYVSWQQMRARCYNTRHKSYSNYGGRGITVCDMWRNEFFYFLLDMGRRPGPGYSIDRYPDNNGNYEPGNCRWATATEQQNNRRVNRRLELNGVSHTVREWSRLTGIADSTIRMRLERLKLPVEVALTRPVRESVLTAEDVREIRHQSALGVLHSAIARKFGVGHTAITKTVNRIQWGNIA